MRAGWPAARVLLLADTKFADNETARRAWLDWAEQSDLDAAPWAEVRVLAALVDRIAEVAPDYPHLERVRGSRRFIFINGQRIFAQVRPMLAALAAEGIDMMLLKGAARIAKDPRAAAGRSLGDIDVLLRREQQQKAWSIAQRDNWHLVGQLSPYAGGTLAGQAAMSHALPFSSSPDYDRPMLDLHHFSRSLCRNVGDDDGMWTRGQAGTFLDLPVTLPSPTDQLRHSLTHALMFARQGRSIDWIFDAHELLTSENINWTLLAGETIESSTQYFVGAALLLLKERLGFAIPGDVVDQLVDSATSKALEGEFTFRTTAYYSGLQRPELNEAAFEAAAIRADRALRRLRRTRQPVPKVSAPEGIATPKRAAAPGVTVFPAPRSIRPGDTLRLRITFDAFGPMGRLAIQLPQLVAAQWPPKRFPRVKRITRTVTIPANLLLMTGKQVVGLRLEGKRPMENLAIEWSSQGPLRHRASRLRSALRKLRAALRKPSSPRHGSLRTPRPTPHSD